VQVGVNKNVQQKYDSVVHYATKSYFRCIFFFIVWNRGLTNRNNLGIKSIFMEMATTYWDRYTHP